MNAENNSELPKAQVKLLEEVEALLPAQDLLLIKLLVTNQPLVAAEYGEELVYQAISELEKRLQGLSSIANLEQISPVLIALRANDTSNPMGVLREVKAIVSALNASGTYGFLLKVSIAGIITDHTSPMHAQDWLLRLNLALMKSARTSNPELVTTEVALAEKVRAELLRIGAGSTPPEGMYWVFQPINYVETGEVFGYEALCRWDSPTLGLVSPEIFIQEAEDLSKIQIIDFWTLQAVENAYPELRKRGGHAISMNISAKTVGSDHNDFFSAIGTLLPKLTEEHFELIIELTETSVVENEIDLSMGLLGLRKRGAKIAIDDFGTGKTSLRVISSLPTDYVKLDGSLLEAERPDLSRGLLELGVKFAQLVEADVIVEKVETQTDLDLAKAVGARYAQGWLFGKPVDLRTPEAKP